MKIRNVNPDFRDAMKGKLGNSEGYAFVLSGLSPESTKQIILCALCGSAVNPFSKKVRAH